MFTKHINLGPTKSYTNRTAVWISGGTLPIDGFMVLSVYSKSGEETDTYGVCVVDTVDGVVVKVKVWKLPTIVDQRTPDAIAAEIRRQNTNQRPYFVSVGGGKTTCNCDANRRHRGDGFECKHATAVKCCLSEGLLRSKEFQGV